MEKLLILFLIVVGLIVLATSETLDILYIDDINACIAKKQVFSFDTFACVDINLSINSKNQAIIDSIDQKNQIKTTRR